MILLVVGIIIGIILGIIIYKSFIKPAPPIPWREKQLELENKHESEIHKLENQHNEMFNNLKFDYKEETNELKSEYKDKLNSLEESYKQIIKGNRQDAISRSRSTIMGKLWEQVAPYLPGFKYHPSDMRFIGSPIDYIVFKGMNKKDINEVIFLEIKSGQSKLNAQEEKLKRVIDSGKIKWEQINLQKQKKSPIVDSNKIDKELNRIKKHFI